jgi:alanine racemase
LSRAWAEIDLAALAHNVRALRTLVEPAGVCVVVKADGYGHGAVAVGRTAMHAGAAMLAVAQVDEARRLRDAGLDGRVLLLSEPAPDEVADAVALGLELTAYTDAAIAAIAARASAHDPVPIHVKVDTGMHRLGAAPADVIALAARVDADPRLVLEAVWTHCAVADELDDSFTSQQLGRFEAVLEQLAQQGVRPASRHAANSAAAIAHSQSRFDLVRCGIAVYGIDPAPTLHGMVDLRPAMRFTSTVSFVKQVAAGERISYGLRHRFDADTVVATVPVGYADGVPRRLGLLGQRVLIGGRLRPIVGVVTMDQLMVDCGPAGDDAAGDDAAGDVAAGDEVVLLGTQGDEMITPQEWADQLDTIAYEAVCGIGHRVERRYTAP